MTGRDKVMRLYLGVVGRVGAAVRARVRTLNGLPAAVLDIDGAPPGWARRTVMPRGLGDDLAVVLSSPPDTVTNAVVGLLGCCAADTWGRMSLQGVTPA